MKGTQYSDPPTPPEPNYRSGSSAAREGELLAVAFHSELGADDRLHRLFLERVAQREPAGALLFDHPRAKAIAAARPIPESPQVMSALRPRSRPVPR